MLLPQTDRLLALPNYNESTPGARPARSLPAMTYSAMSETRNGTELSAKTPFELAKHVKQADKLSNRSLPEAAFSYLRCIKGEGGQGINLKVSGKMQMRSTLSSGPV